MKKKKRKIKKKIEVNKIIAFQINEEKIKFTTEDESTFTMEHLELNTSEINKIESFLKVQLGKSNY